MEFKNRIDIYIGNNVKNIYSDFDKLRPNNISFSMFLANAMNEYIKKYNPTQQPIIIDNSVNNDVKILSSPITKLTVELRKLNNEEFNKVYTKVKQLNVFMDIEMNKRI